MIFSVFEQFQFHIGSIDVSLLFSFLYNKLLTYHVLNLYDYWNSYYLYVMWIYSVVIDPVNRLGNSGANEGAEAISHVMWGLLTKFNFVSRDLSMDWVQLEVYYVFRCEAFSSFLSDFIGPMNLLLTEYHNDLYSTLPFPYFCYFYNDGVEKFFYLYVPFFADYEIEDYFPIFCIILNILILLFIFFFFLFSNWGFFAFTFFFFLVILFFFKPFIFFKDRRFLLSSVRILFNKVYTFFYELVYSYLKEETRYFFPFIFFLFLFISVINLIGLIPYSFALTSHLIVTLSLSVISWGGFLLYGFEKHGFKLFSIFYPKGLSFYLVPFICLIELVSHLTRLISLSLRLFSNIVAGHILLDLISVFLFKISISSVFSFKLLLLPFGFGIILVLFFFEFAICLLQGYIFAVLSCIYCKDYIDLSH